MEEEVKTYLTGILIKDDEKDTHTVNFKGQEMIINGCAIFISTSYSPTDDEVMEWFKGTENIEQIVRL